MSEQENKQRIYDLLIAKAKPKKKKKKNVWNKSFFMASIKPRP